MRWTLLRIRVGLARTGLEAERAALAQTLDDDGLRADVAQIACRFDAGADPEGDDEIRAALVLRARATLAATAPFCDPLQDGLAGLDARWAPLADAAWVLDDAAWEACWAGLEPPSPATWWGARGRAPSERQVEEALGRVR